MAGHGWIQPRREFIRAAGLLALAPAVAIARPASSASRDIVETADGRLRGRAGDGVVTFKGVPYAADTGGANRFRTPQPVAKWAGIRDTFEFGERCPQERGGPMEAAKAARYGENCCVLNIYTPSLDRHARRPVLFWIHGGGFRSGSGDSPATDGTAMARFGDMVVVTVNHRLNLFGYTNLAYLHPDFADSANVGQLDLIQALAWVKENISQFGGDPARVTLIGESGGGAKISALAMMPVAHRLYARTINMSGPGGFFLKTTDQTEATTEALLEVLEIPRNDPRRLQDVPFEQLLTAHAKALANLGADQLRPSVDGRHLVAAPMTPHGIKLLSRVPGIMTYCATEATPWLLGDRRNLRIDEVQLKARIAAQFGLDEARTRAVFEGYRQDNPERTPWEMLVAITSDAMIRTPMRRAAEARAAAGGAPVHLGNFAWTSALEGGIWGGPHGVDVAFAFGNLGASRFVSAGDTKAAAASFNLMSSYAAFARNGTPSSRRMPNWPRLNLATRPTMVIGDISLLVDDPLRGDRLASDLLPVQPTFQITDGKLVHGMV